MKSPTLHNLKILVSNKQALWIIIYAFSSYTSISLLGAIWGTYYLQTLGIPRNSAAAITSMIWLGLAVGSPLIGHISDNIKKRKPLLVLCVLFSALFSIAIILCPYQTPIVFVFLYFGLGFFGAGQTLSFATLLDRVAPNQHATAMGLNNTSVMLSGAIIPPLVGFIVELFAHSHHHLSTVAYDRHQFMLGFSIVPIICLFGAMIAIFKIQEKSDKTKTP